MLSVGEGMKRNGEADCQTGSLNENQFFFFFLQEH